LPDEDHRPDDRIVQQVRSEAPGHACRRRPAGRVGQQRGTQGRAVLEAPRLLFGEQLRSEPVVQIGAVTVTLS